MLVNYDWHMNFLIIFFYSKKNIKKQQLKRFIFVVYINTFINIKNNEAIH